MESFVFFITYLPVSQSLVQLQFLPTMIFDTSKSLMKILQKKKKQTTHSFAQKCVSMLSLQDCFFSIFPGKDPKIL